MSYDHLFKNEFTYKRFAYLSYAYKIKMCH